MKLYLYDHCPFCVRVQMVAGWRRVPVEIAYLLNDDEQAHFDLVGAKMVPILQFDDGRAMIESLDIVEELDRAETGAPHLDPRRETEAQLADLAMASRSISRLLFPRDVRIGLPEFATPGAVAYFQCRKEAQLGIGFDEALAESETHIDAVAAMLAEMAEAPLPEERLSLGDVLLFPTLRNLTMVAGLEFPGWTARYVAHVSAKSGVQLYHDRAI